MTVVEFFDVDDIENIVSTLLCRPEKVIFLCDKADRFERILPYYEKIVKDRNINVRFFSCPVDRNNLEAIVSALDKIVLENENCIFDLSGGDDLYLVAVGIVYQMYKDKVQLHRFNIRNGRLSDCDADGNTVCAEDAEISIEENITAYGGRVIYDDESACATHRWNFSGGFLKDVDSLWEVYTKNSVYWNKLITITDNFAAHCSDNENPLCVRVPRRTLEDALSKQNIDFFSFRRLFDGLRNRKLIFGLEIGADNISFTFKNFQIKRCLTKSGLVLELFVTVNAIEAQEGGVPVYNDVMTGVTIDWDGVVTDRYSDVGNEIDVVMMKGLVPVFVSCKNGDVDVNELYKLNTVAQRFGGKHAKKVLVATEIEKASPLWKHFLLRAKEMQIAVFSDIKKMQTDKIRKKISAFWSNNDF